ncbi:hypothetical protein Aduo_015964 [Ancylostoma duodenale]
MSVIRRVQLEWSCNDSELPNSVIIKIPFTAAVHDALDKSSGTTSRQEDMNLLQKVFHSVESRFYGIIQGEEQKPLLVPTIYANEDSDANQPVIVMQDYHSCYVVDLVQGFSEKQLFAIVDQIVKLQAFAIRNEKCGAFQRPRELRGPVTSAVISAPAHLKCIKIFMANTFDRDHDWMTKLVNEYENGGLCRSRKQWKKMDQLMGTFTDQCKLICLNLMESAPAHLKCIKIFMANTFDRDHDWMTKLVNEYENGERSSVLTHGDLWSANILWRDNASIGGIVDWQGAHRGSPVEDLLRVLSTSTTTENRRRFLRPLLDCYRRKMVDILGDDAMFSRESIDEELRHFAPLGCMMTIFATAMWINSSVLEKDGESTTCRRNEMVRRCSCYVEDVAALCGWSQML